MSAPPLLNAAGAGARRSPCRAISPDGRRATKGCATPRPAHCRGDRRRHARGQRRRPRRPHDADVHAHEQPHEEVWHVVAGALKLTLGDDTRVVRAGEAAIVRGGQRHSVRAIQRTHAIVVDYPVRESLAGIRLR
jgi:mannose-6-phosphate isomerase-like protein (cupin superfamily)